MAQEGNKIKFATNGIERATSNYNASKGGCNEIIGMIYRDGSLVPYEPVNTNIKVSQTLDGTDYPFINVWVHKTTKQNNYIAITFRNNSYYLVWINEASLPLTQQSTDYWKTITSNLPSTTTKIDFVGNMIVVNGTIYLFKNGSYSAGFDINNIQFRMNLGAQGNGVAVMYDGVKFSYSTSGSTNLPKLYEKTFGADKTYEQINADFKLLEAEVKKGDYITGACFLRYAIKLYDGSYVGVSRPVLVNSDNYYSINGEKYSSSGNPTRYTYNANPLKFALKTSSVCTEEVPGLRLNPQLGLIQSLFGSTLFWNYIQMYDEGNYVTTLGEIVNIINGTLEAEQSTAQIADSDTLVYDISKLYNRNIRQGYNTLYKNFQPVDLDYWLLAKGKVGFREIIQFNNNKFNKDKYYKYDINQQACSRLMYWDYVTNGNGIRQYEKNKGWTWGAIPYIVPRLYDTDGSQSAVYNTSNLPMIIAATLCPYAAGHDKTVTSANYATLLEWMQKTTNQSPQVVRDPWDVLTTILTPTPDYFDSNPSWFTTRYRKRTSSNTPESIFVYNGEHPYNKAPFSDARGCVFSPMNEHIGELGFGVFNKSFFEGNTTAETNNNVSMVFGRECFTPVYELLEANNIPEGLVQSVDIFMTTPVSVHEDYKTDSIRFDTMAAHRPYRKEKDVVDDLNKSLGKFYKIHTIPIEEILSYVSGSSYCEHPLNKTMMPYINRGSIANLEQQELLQWSGDNKMEYKVSYVYNNKLHIAQIEEIYNANLYDDCNDEISHCVDSSSEDCYDEATNSHLDVDSRMANCNIAINGNQGVPGSNGFKQTLLTSLFRQGITNPFTDIPDIRLVYLIEITIDGVTSTIVQKQKIDVIRQHPNNVGFFYPNSDAKKVTLLGFEATTTGGTYGKYFYEIPNKVFNLTQDKDNMIAYNFQLNDAHDYLSPTKISTYNVIANESQFPYKKYESNNTYARDLNIFKVSETNQPLVFPYANTYRVGYGKIIAFSSYTTALSQGQFGEYPLLVFTTEGIFTMRVDTSGIGSYVSNAPLSREVCTNTNTIVQVDGGVFFGTEKGLMFISGDNVKKWSEQINGEPKNLPNSSANFTIGDGLVVYYNAITNANIVQLQSTTTPVTTSISQEDFVEYLNMTDTNVSYLYELNKLLVYNKTKDYSYMIDIDEEGKCTKLGKKYYYDNSDYPNCLISDGTTLRKFTLDGDTNACVDCLIQTRPILLDTDMPKSQFRVALRGIFNNYVPQSGTNYSGLYVLGSIDGEKWMFIGGSEIAHISSLINDIGTTIERMSIKYLIVIYASKNNAVDTKIDNIEISSNEKYNDKTR